MWFRGLIAHHFEAFVRRCTLLKLVFQNLVDKLFNIGILTGSIVSYIPLSRKYRGITLIKLSFFTITLVSRYYCIRNKVRMKMNCKSLVLWSFRSHATISSSRRQIDIKEEIDREIEIEIFLIVRTEGTNI